MLFRKEHPEFRVVGSYLKKLLIYEDIKSAREHKAVKETTEIKKLVRKGMSLRDIGNKFGMSYEGVRQRLIRYS